ncbi:MAG TPA: DUF4097 family beta strand repeat-containing protein [Gemmatimonadaceae bacterium]|nr:DUF4097 family beta strand repeat-containing protein [Gemmatimonadaceae bacterium]
MNRTSVSFVAVATFLGTALALPAQSGQSAPPRELRELGRAMEQVGKIVEKSVEKSIDQALRAVEHSVRHLDRELEREFGRPSGQQGARRQGQQSATSIDTTVAFPRDGVVDLSSMSGDIVLTGWDRSEARIRASSERGQLQWRVTATRITIESEGYRGRSDETRYELTVPRGVRVVMRSQSGDLSARGTRGPVDAHSSSGDIEVVDAADRIELGSLSGDITASQLRGEVDVTSLNGIIELADIEGRSVDVESTSSDIVLANVRSRDVSASTVNGEVEYRGTIEAGGQYEFHSHSGTITLTIPANASARFGIETFSGELDSDFPVTLQPDRSGRQGRRLEFVLGNGGATVIAETFSGDVEIRRDTRR